MKIKLKDSALIGVCAAIIAICAQIFIPLPMSPVMFSMQIFGIMLVSVILGAKRGTLAVLTYLLIGLAGVPVFSGFRGGFSVLAGPTGGYLISYIPMSFIIGRLSEISVKRTHLMCSVSMLVGMAVCYILGSIQYAFVTNISLWHAVMTGVVPFVAFDLIKAATAIFIGLPVRQALAKSSAAKG